MFAFTDVGNHQRRGPTWLAVDENVRAGLTRLDADRRDGALELHWIERVVVGLVDGEAALRADVAVGLEFDDVRAGLYLGDHHHLRQLGRRHARLRGALRVVGRR